MDTIMYKFVHDSPEFPHSSENPSSSWIKTIYYKNPSQLKGIRCAFHQVIFDDPGNHEEVMIRNPIGFGKYLQNRLWPPSHIIEQCNHTIVTRDALDFQSYYRDWRLTNKYVFDGVDFTHKRFTKIYAAPCGMKGFAVWNWFSLYDEDKENLICVKCTKEDIEYLISHPYLEGVEVIYLDEKIPGGEYK